MTQPLKEFLIVINGKPFIKCKNPTVRVDFKYTKPKMRRYKVGDTTFNEQLTEAILEAIINASGYPELSEEDLRNIIRGIVDSQTA